MMDTRMEISRVFQIPLQQIDAVSDHLVMVSVPSLWVKKMESVNVKERDVTPFCKEWVKNGNPSSYSNCEPIHIFALRCCDVHCDDSEIPPYFEKVHKNSFSHTLSSISFGNRDGLYKDSVRNSPQCHCPILDNDGLKLVSNIECCRKLVMKMHGVELKELQENGVTDSSEINKTEDVDNEWPVHSNLKKILCGFHISDMIYLFASKPSYTVLDAIMYSPALLTSGSIRTLFVLYQILQFLRYFQDNFCMDLSALQWNNIELNPRLWAKVNLPGHAYLMSKPDREPVFDSADDDAKRKREEGCDVKQLNDLLDKWVCGELSNFNYLMFLNKLAGRTKLDPNHHPVLPWVSSLESENGELRDLTKSKYRLNKGDHQLDIQYSMMKESADLKDTKSKFQAPNLPQVPHHVPEFLSDITYYVYMARRTSKDILCKLVRSYWEPNEYPASIQRMQAWTPDECIPEFYTDAEVFKSIHEDMTDLAVPAWCVDAEDFVRKHRAMLESDSVSRDLHHWIDVTFGYKLSGKEAIEEKNVCLPLVDNHTKQTNRGITQLFRVPHPQKRCKKMSPEFSLILENGDDGLQFLEDLDELEKLLTFKSKIWNKTDFSRSLCESLETSRCNILSKDQKQTIMSERNIIMFLCLMIELYLPSQTWDKNGNLPLDKRFEMCLQCYKLQKLLLPSGIKFAVEYFIDNLRFSEQETFERLSKTSNLSGCHNYVSIFRTISDRGMPSPTPALLLSRYIHIFPFPPFFDDLYNIVDFILLGTDHYTKSLSEQALSVLSQDLHTLFEKLQDTKECVEILIPYVQQLLRQPSLLANVQFLTQNFDVLSKAMGSKTTQENLFPLILAIYESSTEWSGQIIEDDPSSKCGSGDQNVPNEKVVSWNGEEVECEALSLKEDDAKKTEDISTSPAIILCELYNETFLLQLSSRLGLLSFMENIPRCLANALIVTTKDSETENKISDASEKVICWLMQRVGPTLTSKYIVRHLFRVLTQCFLIENDTQLTKECGRHASILACLTHAASLFGPSMITLQYFPQLIHNVSSAVAHPKYAPRHQAAVEASVAATTHFLLYLSDTILVEQLSRLSKEVIIPITHLLARTDVCFYGGPDSRKSLCMNVVHLIKLIVIRIGREMARENLTSLFQEFFSHFSRQQASNCVKLRYHEESFDSIDLDTVVIDHDADTRTFKVGNTILRENSSGVRKQLHKSWFNASPTPSPNKGTQVVRLSTEDDGASVEEIEATFCPETAYCSYVSITRIVGNIHMENILGKHHERVATLCSKYEATKKVDDKMHLSSSPMRGYLSKSTVVGNKIIVAAPISDMHTTTMNDKIVSGGMHTRDLSNGNTKRNLDVFLASQLTENWLAYWEHEIGLPENDKHIHFNQIELQAFSGHSSAVRCLCCHQSEEWFISGSKDKMVKIWSLYNNSERKKENQTMPCNPCLIYKNHKKNVNYVGISETEQCVLSNDGNLHVWDPYNGQQVMVFDSSDVKSGFALVTTLPSPQRYALAITNEGNLRFVDFRRKLLAHEFKTMTGNSAGIARSICTASNGQWVAIGFSTGVLSILDVRTGVILSMRQAHEADIATMTTISENRFLTASTDQTVSIWDVDKAAPVIVYRSFQEPVHVVQTFHNEIVSASVANRVNVHLLPGENIDNGAKSLYDKPRAVSKLRADSFRGVLTSFSVLPMKRQLLIASDNGSIKLMA